MADRAYLQQVARKLADEGKLIEAGWLSMRLFAVPLGPPVIPQAVVRRRRDAALHAGIGQRRQHGPVRRILTDWVKRNDKCPTMNARNGRISS